MSILNTIATNVPNTMIVSAPFMAPTKSGFAVSMAGMAGTTPLIPHNRDITTVALTAHFPALLLALWTLLTELIFPGDGRVLNMLEEPLS